MFNPDNTDTTMTRGKFVIEEFAGVDHFLSVVGKREPNKVFQSEGPIEKQNSHDSNFSFRGTHNWSESCDIMAQGYKEGLQDLNQSKAGVRVRTASNVSRNMPHADIVGFTPHVPNAIAGIPQSMITVRRVQRKAKTVSILYDMGASASIDKGRFTVAGRHLMDVISTLELQGYRIQLDVLEAFCTNSQIGMCIIRLKNHRQPINPLKLSYSLLHPSFFRRQSFCWLETCPEITHHGFTGGYGYPLYHHVSSNSDKLRTWLKEQGILQEGVFYTNFYEAEETSANDLIAKMGLTNKL